MGNHIDAGRFAAAWHGSLLALRLLSASKGSGITTYCLVLELKRTGAPSEKAALLPAGWKTAQGLPEPQIPASSVHLLRRLLTGSG